MKEKEKERKKKPKVSREHAFSSAKAEYACAAMLELAVNHAENRPLRIQAIADAQDIPPRFLVQILLQLKTAGLVVSARGASGGYQLARPPAEVTLAAIVNAVDDRALTPRPVPAGTPRSPTVDALLGLWHEIRAAEQRALEKVSLAELVRRSQDNHALSYQI